MKRYVSLAITLILGTALGLVGGRLLSAQDQLKTGTELARIDVPGAKGMEAVLVMHEVPGGGESGKHTQSGAEIVYIQDGAVTLEVAGQAPKTVNAGQAFTTTAGQVHNVKNASTSAPAKALAFYIAKKGTKSEDLSKPAR